MPASARSATRFRRRDALHFRAHRPLAYVNTGRIATVLVSASLLAPHALRAPPRDGAVTGARRSSQAKIRGRLRAAREFERRRRSPHFRRAASPTLLLTTSPRRTRPRSSSGDGSPRFERRQHRALLERIAARSHTGPTTAADASACPRAGRTRHHCGAAPVSSGTQQVVHARGEHDEAVHRADPPRGRFSHSTSATERLPTAIEPASPARCVTESARARRIHPAARPMLRQGNCARALVVVHAEAATAVHGARRAAPLATRSRPQLRAAVVAASSGPVSRTAASRRAGAARPPARCAASARVPHRVASASSARSRRTSRRDRRSRAVLQSRCRDARVHAAARRAA